MGLFNKKELKRIAELEQQLADLQQKQRELGIYEYEEAQRKIVEDRRKHEEILSSLLHRIENLTTTANNLDNKIEVYIKDSDSLEKKTKTQRNKLEKIKNLYKAIEYSIEAYDSCDLPKGERPTKTELAEIEEITPTVTLHLNCLNMQELRKAYRENEKLINETLEKYKSRYTTKANQAIYKLMVIALQAELQNILTAMKYDKLEKATANVKEVCQKYFSIAGEGNQSIVGTLRKFIGEIEYFFLKAVEIEYEYYVQKERAKEEQAAIREQMRQEAEEKRELEMQRKQVEKEESKYITEMENVKAQLQNTEDDAKIQALNKKIAELQEKLSHVAEKKDEIINRQNGKAGNVYVISNLGSFGDNVFKVGMTRRLEPLDRIKELGDASVPFEFDVHAMIFSEDAVSLENKLHKILDDYRMNKVNLRKEFFKLPLSEIQKIVLTEDPAAEFNETMLAEQYRQTLSINEKS